MSTTIEGAREHERRGFDALTIAITSGGRRASRRRVLRGVAALAAIGFAPGVAHALDGGVAPAQPAGSVGCASGADCAAGEICLNGGCAPRETAGTVSVSLPATTTTVAEGENGVPVAGTTSVTPADTVPLGGVGGLIQPGAPLPARIYAGRCGALGEESAFQLIDIGSVEGVEADESPQGALTAIPAEFSTTVVNAALADLLEAEYAIDVRVDDADPATSIACGDIGGPVEAGAAGAELAVGLQERGQSAYSGIGLLQDEGDRTLVRVFLARGLDDADAALVAPQVAPSGAATTETPAVADTAAVPQAVGTPVVGSVSPLGVGSRVLTSIDVNLRAEPADDAPVVTILGQGVELEVTGAPANGWVPVLEPSSGQRGFVSDQFITLVV
ncbi:MAG: SH3 domain-containing protein [Chloroflexia bacterium]|nr:SH3 domain-containing protein [Chloroflexia bacterium]